MWVMSDFGYLEVIDEQSGDGLDPLHAERDVVGLVDGRLARGVERALVGGPPVQRKGCVAAEGAVHARRQILLDLLRIGQVRTVEAEVAVGNRARELAVGQTWHGIFVAGWSGTGTAARSARWPRLCAVRIDERDGGRACGPSSRAVHTLSTILLLLPELRLPARCGHERRRSPGGPGGQVIGALHLGDDFRCGDGPLH